MRCWWELVHSLIREVLEQHLISARARGTECTSCCLFFIIYQVFMNLVHLGVLNSDGMSQLGGSAKTALETVK